MTTQPTATATATATLHARVLAHLGRARGAWRTAAEIRSAVALDASMADVIAVCRAMVDSGEVERSAPLLGSVAQYRTRG